MKQKAVCISPLDWGLGHATRCISLIRSFESLDYKIYIASESKQEVILREAFPTATFLHLKGYRIWYTKNNALFILGIMIQIPKIVAAIFNEYFWLKRTAKKYQFDLIVSDNRFGFFHKKIKSVFITHQLELQTPYDWSTRLNQAITYSIINKYTACWIADMKPPHNLSGDLANPKKLPNTPIWYMNCLSRLQEVASLNLVNENNQEATCFLGIVSGPEPQRTLLENILWEQGNALGERFVVLAGLPDKQSYHKKTTKGLLYHHLNGAALKKEIKKAEYIICRGGYTTLMELIPFQKKLIFIPTPGQTEQAYLGKYWQSKKWAICFSQAEFDLKIAIEQARQFEYQTPPFTAFSTADLVNELKRLSL
jgi:uncharacterized protein (TIGR00661 family)